MTTPPPIEQLIRQCLESTDDPGGLLVQLVAEAARQSGFTSAATGASVDLDRARRCGHSEVIYAEGKSVEGLLSIIERQAAAGQDVLATRVTEEQALAVCARWPDVISNRTARTLRLEMADPPRPIHGRVVVITAGTSDRPVAEEALETLAWMHIGCDHIVDVGVAGPWRLLEQLPRLQSADAVIVVAGMEGALPSAVGGWLACPVIAVPTSVGYGASLGGLAALLGMLNSCAANVVTVNIDAGFKAGYVAGLIASTPE